MHVAKYVGAAAVIALLAATPTYADQGKGERGDDRGLSLGKIVRLFNDDRGERRGQEDAHKVAIEGQVSAQTGTTLTVLGKKGATYTVNVSTATIIGTNNATTTLSTIAVGDRVKVKGTLNGSVITATRVTEKAPKHDDDGPKIRPNDLSVGVITSVSGGTFTMDPLGPNALATVTTDGNTVFKLNGVATTSTALKANAIVFVKGTTTASSTSNTLISASVVHVIDTAIGFFKHLRFWR